MSDEWEPGGRLARAHWERLDALSRREERRLALESCADGLRAVITAMDERRFVSDDVLAGARVALERLDHLE